MLHKMHRPTFSSRDWMRVSNEAQLEAALSGHDPNAFKVPVKPDWVRFEGVQDVPPTLSSEEQERVARWLSKDAAYLQRSNEERALRKAEQEALQPQQDWLGLLESRPLGFTLKPAGLGSEGVKGNVKLAEEEDSLTAIRLDVDVDKVQLRDTFTWNARG
jgi:hypothetical protein